MLIVVDSSKITGADSYKMSKNYGFQIAYFSKSLESSEYNRSSELENKKNLEESKMSDHDRIENELKTNWKRS